MARTVKVGEYYYWICLNSFKVSVYTEVSEDGLHTRSEEVAHFSNREDARRYVWEHNGWGTPKSELKNKYCRY